MSTLEIKSDGSITVAEINYPVGTILITYYADMSPRYYKVVKETPHKVMTVRLKHKLNSNKPSHQEYPDGKKYIMTKKDNKLTYHGVEVQKY